MDLETQEGVILKKIPYSEADEIVTVLLKSDGIRRFFVPGSRKSKRKFAGLIDYFAHLKLTYNKSHKGLWRLVEANSRPGTTQATDIIKYAFSNMFAELICEFTPEAVDDDELYELWNQLQDAYKNNEFTAKAGTYFIQQALTHAGYAIRNDTTFLKYPREVFTRELTDKDTVWDDFMKHLVTYCRQIIQKPLPASEFYLKISLNPLKD